MWFPDFPEHAYYVNSNNILNISEEILLDTTTVDIKERKWSEIL